MICYPLGTQRRVKEAMPTERHQRLGDIGFVWDPLSDAWEDGYSELVQFKDREGHCKVIISHKEDGFALGQWIGSNRNLLCLGV